MGVECEHARGKGLACRSGLDGFSVLACCFDHSRCPVNDPADNSKKDYRLVYNISWTTQVQAVKPVDTYVIDGLNCGIMENLTPHKEWRGTKCDDKMCISEVTQEMPTSGNILWAYTHQHSGAVNTTLSVNGVPVCTSFPHIGTDLHDHPGNEKGYVVGFRLCIDPLLDAPIAVKKGDKLTINAFASIDPADTRFTPFPGGSRTGFMNLFYFFLHEDTQPESYVCDGNACVAGQGGVPLDICKAACGPGVVV